MGEGMAKLASVGDCRSLAVKYTLWWSKSEAKTPRATTEADYHGGPTSQVNYVILITT